MRQLRLKRFTLDQLSKEMPVMGQEEQRQSVGGAWVFGVDQYPLGSGGPATLLSNTYLSPDPGSIYFIQKDDDSACMYLNGGYIYGSSYSSAPVSLSQANSTARSQVVRAMANSMGLSNVDTYSNASDPKYSEYKDGRIRFNTANAYFTSGNVNYYDIMVTLVHERYHMGMGNTPNSYQEEIDARMAAMNSQYWQYASPANQQRIINDINYYKGLLGQK